MTQPFPYFECRGWIRSLKAPPSSDYLDSEKFNHPSIRLPHNPHSCTSLAPTLKRLLEDDPHSKLCSPFKRTLLLASNLSGSLRSLRYTPNHWSLPKREIVPQAEIETSQDQFPRFSRSQLSQVFISISSTHGSHFIQGNGFLFYLVSWQKTTLSHVECCAEGIHGQWAGERVQGTKSRWEASR